ncbi:helix-turn-helix domain-containing protein [Kribbella sp. NBC_01245]|uniref:GbsR/MarR family transcriptional regulator n=1 Tax=Kribbella sp. NBC_01245 TaxID=2903578 RepID=UPI002E2A21FE|nr:helix-turn-helix domain-containing protein [Kribbella sp. NBC_01245]
MPGGRLSRPDRQRIAALLADGLGYSEIARELGRPTSTISREVARNGGPGDYQADRAHRATEQRARRTKTSQLPTATTVVEPGYGRNPQAAQDFQEQLAALMVQTGMPRMAARVLSCLFTTDAGSLTSADLVERLRVSPASISNAIGYLEGLELIHREPDPGRRREKYVIYDDVWLRTWQVSARQNAMWADTAELGVEVFGAETPAGVRLEEMRQFIGRLSEDMAGGPTEAAINDALTVTAALIHAGRPRSTAELATALDWPDERVTRALRDADYTPDLIDPIALRRTESGAYAIDVRPERLSDVQRAALRDS